MAALWRLVPVTLLTLRQFTGGRTARLIFVLSLIPALFAVIYLARPSGITPNEFLAELFRELIVPTLLPIIVLLPATAAFGNELEDGTLPYLLMKPVSRLRIVLGKYAAVLLVTVPALLVGLAVTTLVTIREPGAQDVGRLFIAMAGASVAATALLAALFVLASLIIPRALLAGMIYIFAWESLLGRFLPGVRAASSREYALRVFDGLRDTDSSLASSAALTMLVIVAVCLLLAIWRLRSIQID